MKPGAAVLELLGYLAYETVGQLVDLSLLVKRDADGHSDPLSTDYVSVEELAPNKPSYGSTVTFITVPALAPASPGPSSPSSPPSSPSTPNANPPPVTCGAASVMQTPGEGINGGEDKVIQTGSLGRPTKAKKKAKTKAALPSSVVFGAANALQPWHIREAHRRYSHFIGPMSAYSPATRTSVLRQTLCC
jgi:transcription initiation protein SPT3